MLLIDFGGFAWNMLTLLAGVVTALWLFFNW